MVTPTRPRPKPTAEVVIDGHTMTYKIKGDLNDPSVKAYISHIESKGYTSKQEEIIPVEALFGTSAPIYIGSDLINTKPNHQYDYQDPESDHYDPLRVIKEKIEALDRKEAFDYNKHRSASILPNGHVIYE